MDVFCCVPKSNLVKEVIHLLACEPGFFLLCVRTRLHKEIHTNVEPDKWSSCLISLSEDLTHPLRYSHTKTHFYRLFDAGTVRAPNSSLTSDSEWHETRTAEGHWLKWPSFQVRSRESLGRHCFLFGPLWHQKLYPLDLHWVFIRSNGTFVFDASSDSVAQSHLVICKECVWRV